MRIRLRQLVSSSSYESFRPGQVLALQGERGERAFIILEGEVEVTLKGDNEERSLGHRGSGEIVGEMALLEDKPRVATLRASSEVKTFVLERGGFHALIKSQPELGLALNRIMSSRIRNQERLIDELLTHPKAA